MVGMRAGLLAVRAGSAGKRFRPTRERRSRVDGRVCPSTRSLMVRPPAGSPYETSTNRRACGLWPRRTCGLRRAAGASRPAAIGAGFVRLAAGWEYLRPAGVCGCGGAVAVGLRARTGGATLFSASGGKNFNLCGGHETRPRGSCLSDLRFCAAHRTGGLRSPHSSLPRWQEFQLMRPQVEILAAIAGFSRCGRGGGAPEAEAQSGGGRAPACGSGRASAPAARAALASRGRKKSGTQGSMGRCAHRPVRSWFVHLCVRLTKPPQIAGAPRAGGAGVAPRHPERRARSARSRRTSPGAKASGGVEASWSGSARVFRPSASARQESAPTCGNPGTQGSMGRCAHRPVRLWFVHLRVRLTKPPQIAGACWLGPRLRPAGERAVPPRIRAPHWRKSGFLHGLPDAALCLRGEAAGQSPRRFRRASSEWLATNESYSISAPSARIP